MMPRPNSRLRLNSCRMRGARNMPKAMPTNTMPKTTPYAGSPPPSCLT